ncbi:TIM-barrel domain-containing protein [Teredinibacter franksiae]|uniref:TIM-barrel domain-containing protein n=1 Tax=Teredinibacter franksiae TaxID=2761453 RepID=UPI00162726AD|nr:TIM-barrel domain-containing protein [Teredinibacter franksiae]
MIPKLQSFKLLMAACMLVVGTACSPKNEGDHKTAQSASYKVTETGVVVLPTSGAAKSVQLEAVSDSIIHVLAAPTTEVAMPESIMVVTKPSAAFTVSEADGVVTLKTAKASATVAIVNGRVDFFDAAGKPLAKEAGVREFSAVTSDPVTPDADSFALRQAFERGETERLYGLGQFQNGQINLAGQNVELTTYNLIISIPFMVSTNNYGVLWDNNSVTNFGDTEFAKPLAEDLKLFDAEGKEGGLTARYYDGDKLVLTRVESDPDYQFLSQGTNRANPFPKEVAESENLRIEWEGSFESATAGTHEFKMYSSGYAKLSIDDELVLDRWRMNWNPWYHNINTNVTAGKRHTLKIDWTPGNGYFRLLHRDPLPADQQALTSFKSETGKAISYYLVAGESADEIIAGYRTLTGKSVMLPRWAYGFWQSRERYKSDEELLGALKEYRDRKIPIDNIVLDWSYWPTDAWGSHDFDPEFFPDPSGMVKKVHDMNAQIMISVWPKFYPSTDNYKELNAKGYMLNRNIEDGNLDWIGDGYPNGFYDAFAEGGRDIFWKQINEKINVHGFDAWWLDAVEPDMHSNTSWSKRKEFMSPNAIGSGAEHFNAYSVPHAEGVYENDRASEPEKRVFILTRSGFGGIQRTGSAIWSGDTVSRWSNLKEQISAGIGTSLAGMPNWTMDIGGFTPEDRFRSNATDKPFVGPFTALDNGQVSEWQELNVRWYQFGAFVPLYRAHGQNPYREIYNIAPEGSEVYNSMVWYTRLRYRLMPYIYSIAGDMYHKDATLMRGLVMDFPKDEIAGNLNDQYMFGPSILVSPVYENGARSRNLYLPAGTSWYDFYTGAKSDGGQHVEAAAPLNRMPLYVKAGSIIPTAPEVQYADQILNAPITLNVYTGADGNFELYEDDGRSYGYEKGEWSRIPFSYNEAAGTLTLGKRQGTFPGMAEVRSVKIRWISGVMEAAADFDSAIAETIEYTGEALTLKRK